MATLDRNDWQLYSGMGGNFAPEQVATFVRIAVPGHEGVNVRQV